MVKLEYRTNNEALIDENDIKSSDNAHGHSYKNLNIKDYPG